MKVQFDPADFMSLYETAEYLKVSYLTVYREARKRRLPALKLGGEWRVHYPTLNHWLDGAFPGQELDEIVVQFDFETAFREFLKEMGLPWPKDEMYDGS